MEYSTEFNAQDLVTGFNLSKDLYGIKVKEQAPTTQEDIIAKYQSLKQLKHFFQAIDQELLVEEKPKTRKRRGGKNAQSAQA